MFKQSLLLLLLSLSALSLSAMEEIKHNLNTKNASSSMQPWVQTATEITVSTLKQSWTIPIAATTTISDTKNWLLANEGIPVGQQHLSARWAEWFFWHKYSLELKDTENVKNVMDIFNTNQFALCLKLRIATNNNT